MELPGFAPAELPQIFTPSALTHYSLPSSNRITNNRKRSTTQWSGCRWPTQKSIERATTNRLRAGEG